MIKLNNKNITYVALADSNNSVKGVKEVWYADTNNSVKLVYRRKDALIEGVDYEKYHWILTDTDNPYIQVDDTCNTDENAYIETTYKSKYTNSGSDMLIGFSINETNNIGLRIFNSAYNGGSTYVDYHKTENGVLSSSRTVLSQSNINAERYIKATFNNLIIDTTEYPSINWGSGFDNLKNPVTRLHTNQHLDNDVRYKRTKLRVNFKEHDLIPCKLLKPVPKWLDANGIRRQIGECGMIDLVSGKFYGNVNSNGTFTVENYYERKEWLVGDGSAYINTKVTSYTGVISTKYNFIESEINNDEVILGRERVNYAIDDWSSRLVINITKTNGRLSLYGSNVNYIQYLTTDTVDIDVVNNTFSTSNHTGSINIGDNVVGRNLFLFASNDGASGQRPFHGKVAYLRIPDKLNLIPCTLTMDLPASMDANNIARTKGTSGMWDLVSDRFYGNVANSGTFKAVNLAEGVDYEVHDWLVGDGSAIIEVTGNIYRDTFSLVTIPTTTTGKRLLTAMSASYDGNKSEYQIMVGESSEFTIRHGIRINNRSTSVIKDFRDNYINNEYEITTYRDGDYYYGNINGVEYNNNRNFGEYQFADEDIVINIYSNGFKLGNFNSGRVDLIPVKLLRSIPSKYDANGIARQVGECGMYDTVNDVFYGNVASSGSFTVSND